MSKAKQRTFQRHRLASPFTMAKRSNAADYAASSQDHATRQRRAAILYPLCLRSVQCKDAERNSRFLDSCGRSDSINADAPRGCSARRVSQFGSQQLSERLSHWRRDDQLSLSVALINPNRGGPTRPIVVAGQGVGLILFHRRNHWNRVGAALSNHDRLRSRRRAAEGTVLFRRAASGASQQHGDRGRAESDGTGANQFREHLVSFPGPRSGNVVVPPGEWSCRRDLVLRRPVRRRDG